LISFWSFFHLFWCNVSDFSEKLWFYIKNRVFWLIFCLHFDQILVFFWPFFDPFLGFLGGYPSPSISAPLVVKKCPKLYIYNIGWGGHRHPNPSSLCHTTKAPMAKATISIGAKNTKGERELTKKRLLCNLPDMLKLKQNNPRKNIPVQRGENESWKITNLPCESPRQLNEKTQNTNTTHRINQRGEREYTKYLLSCELPDIEKSTETKLWKSMHNHVRGEPPHISSISHCVKKTPPLHYN